MSRIAKYPVEVPKNVEVALTRRPDRRQGSRWARWSQALTGDVAVKLGRGQADLRRR